MSKYLDKLTKDYKAFQGRVDRVCEDLKTLQDHNIIKLKDLIGTGVDEMTLEIGKLVDQGHTGKALKDFIDEKSVKAAYAGAESLTKDLQRLYDSEAKLIGELDAELGKLAGLIKDTEKDLKQRDFKAKFGIDSKSQTQIDKIQKDMKSDYVTIEKRLKDFREQVRKGTAKDYLDSQLKTVATGIAFNKTKAVKEMYARLVDTRVVNKYMAEVKKTYDAVIARLDEAEDAIKDGKGDAAGDALKAAGESMKALQKGAAFLSDGLDSHVKGGGADPNDKEMKPLFQAVATCAKLVKDAEARGKAVSKGIKAMA